MKKMIALALSIVCVCTLTACGVKSGQEDNSQSSSAANMQDKAEPEEADTDISSENAAETDTDAVTDNVSEPDGESKILVAYFSVPETTKPDNMNAEEEYSTVVINGEVLGNTQYVAMVIQENTNADLFRIEPVTPYPMNHAELEEVATQEKREEAYPEISAQVDNMEQYDTVFIGYPNWYSDMPRILYSFFENYDLSGKTVIPFVTSGGSGFSNTINTIGELEPNADVIADGFSVSRNTVQDAQNDIIEWLKGLGYIAERENDRKDNGEVSMADISFDYENKRVLLNSGYYMPIVGLGTYALSDDVCISSVEVLLENGGRLIDTASFYGTEESVGEAVRNSNVPREEIFVTTKLYPNQFSDAEAAIEKALETLDIEYIDLMLLHHPGRGDVEAYKALEQAVRDGKIHSIGLSNWYIEELEEFLPQITIMPAVVQNEIHPYYQENDVIPYIQDLGIVVEGWFPFGGRGHTAELLGDEVISSIAEIHHVTSAQVILRWNLQKGVIVIPGSSNPEHIKENLDIFNFELTDEEMAKINGLDRNEKHEWY